MFFLRTLFPSLYVIFSFLFTENVHGFEVRGFVMNGKSPISGAEIYELYKDEPVAITDNNGEFKYETGANSPVEIHAEKKGYYPTTIAERITESNKTQTVEFALENWYEKKSPFKIYTVLEGDKDCILNTWVNISHQCKNTANGYNPTNLNPEKCDSKATVGLYPNLNGAIIIRHLNPKMSFFSGQWSGGHVFPQEPNDIFYYEVSQDLIDDYIDNREQWFELDRSMGGHKEYKDFDEYKIAYMKNFYKYCPRKLKEIGNDSGQKTQNTNQTASLEDKQNAYNEAKETEQLLSNRVLTALTTTATGIGGMELAKGLAEQKADKVAEQDMDAYMATFRCEYGNGKSATGGTTAIELPGGNEAEMIKLSNEYFSLATSLKERKESLGVKPGIESEIILDKSQLGLYDDENVGITGGVYSSLYRAKMGNESDQNQLQDMRSASKKRVVGGAIATVAGLAVGFLGNNLTNNQNNKQNEKNDKFYQNNEAYQEVFPWETEPNKCSYSECLSKLMISERTRAEPRYNIITDFCSKQFSNNPDCEKIMLMYSENSGAILDVDTLLANNYDMDFFKRMTKYYCDSWVCVGEEQLVDTVLFSDNYYKYEDAVMENRQLKTDLEKCFKIAGALNYFDLPISMYNGKTVDIDFTKLDCSELDDGKTDGDIKVKGTDVTKFLKEKPHELWNRVQLLFGKQSDLVHIIKND